MRLETLSDLHADKLDDDEAIRRALRNAIAVLDRLIDEMHDHKLRLEVAERKLRVMEAQQ